MADDALTALLKAAKLSDEQRAGLWDLYKASKNPADLASRLKSLELPDDIKADIWDLKSAPNAKESTEPAKPEPSAGYWEDRGIAGKVWHPAQAPAEQRGDANVIGLSGAPNIGIPPEVVGPGLLAAGSAATSAIVDPALSLAGRGAAAAAAGVRSLAKGAIGATVKGEAAYYALKGLGLPEPVPTIGAILAGRGRGAQSAAAVEEAATVPRGPLGTPTAAPETGLELTRRLRATHQAQTGQTKLPAPAQPVPAPVVAAVGKPKYSLDEWLFVQKLKAAKVPDEQIGTALAELRQLPVAFQKQLFAVPPADVLAVVQQANESGRMVR